MKYKFEIDILKKARDIIANQRGIAHGKFYNEKTDCYCTMGAIIDAYAGGGYKKQVLKTQSVYQDAKVLYYFSKDMNNKFVRLLGFEYNGEAFSWNDKQTDKQAILDKFDATIARLEMEGQEDATSPL